MTDPHMNADAKDLLQRAYSLEGSAESKKLYAEWARTYDKTMLEGLGYLTPDTTARLLARYEPDTNAKILDIGSGTGLAGLALSGLGYGNLDALDYSPQMLGVAQNRNIYAKLFEADLNQPLALETNSYDALICTGTFTHAHVGAGCLDELLRILKPGGHFACTVHKDIWQSEGFEGKSASLLEPGVMKTVYKQMGIYYAGSTEPEGWYIVWRKLG